MMSSNGNLPLYVSRYDQRTGLRGGIERSVDGSIEYARKTRGSERYRRRLSLITSKTKNADVKVVFLSLKGIKQLSKQNKDYIEKLGELVVMGVLRRETWEADHW